MTLIKRNHVIRDDSFKKGFTVLTFRYIFELRVSLSSGDMSLFHLPQYRGQETPGLFILSCMKLASVQVNAAQN